MIKKINFFKQMLIKIIILCIIELNLHLSLT